MSKGKKLALWLLGIIVLLALLSGVFKIFFVIALLAAFWWGIHKLLDEVAKEYKKGPDIDQSRGS